MTSGFKFLMLWLPCRTIQINLAPLSAFVRVIHSQQRERNRDSSHQQYMVSECVTGALCGAGHKTSWVTAGGLGSASTADKAHTHPGLPSLGTLGSQTGAWQPQSGVVLSPHSWEGWAGARLSLCLDSHTIVCPTRELMQTSLKGKFSGWGPKA